MKKDIHAQIQTNQNNRFYQKTVYNDDFDQISPNQDMVDYQDH